MFILPEEILIKYNIKIENNTENNYAKKITKTITF